MFQHFDDIKADWLKVGTMMLVSQLLAGGDIMDQNWQMASLYTLLGFTAYQLGTRNLVDTSIASEYQPIADDWVKVGTMLVVSRLLSGQPLDQAWMQSGAMTLIGFTLYHLITKKFIQGGSLTGNAGLADTIDDVAKFGTMFIFTQLVAGGALTDPNWQMTSAGILAGFAAYNIFVKGMLGNLF